MKSPNLSKLVPQFLQHAEIIKGFSRSTIVSYAHCLSRFQQWLKQDLPVQKIDAPTVYNFQIYLNRFKTPKGKPLAPKTKREYIVSIRSLIRYCHKNDIPTLSLEKIELPKSPEPIVTYMTSQEVQKMFDAVDISDISGLRDLAILRTLFSTGLRISELVSLNRGQVNLLDREFSVRGKGGKVRVAFLSSDATEAITKYLNERNDDFIPLFINHSSNNTLRGVECRLTRESINKMIKTAAKIAHIQKEVSCHTFRHSFATDLLSNGADIRSVQEMLGHASIKTTQIYTHITNIQLKASHFKFHDKPLSNPLWP